MSATVLINRGPQGNFAYHPMSADVRGPHRVREEAASEAEITVGHATKSDNPGGSSFGMVGVQAGAATASSKMDRR
jgi:hypothetical protein